MLLSTNLTTYVSYSYEIDPVSLVDVFSQSNSYQGERFFWQSADKQTTFLGLGIVEKIQGATFEEIQSFQQHFMARCKLLPSTIEQEPILFGGFPFDQFAQNEEPFWQELEQGYFLLPRMLFSQQASKMVVTITVPQKEQEQISSIQQDVTNILSAAVQPIVCPVIEETEIDVANWRTLVEKSVAEIQQGKLKKVVLARQMKLTTEEAFIASTILCNLSEQQPNTYLFVLEGPTRTFIGATPERLIEATPDYFVTASVAGSIARGQTVSEDEALGQSLLDDAKNSHEHGLVVNRIEQELAPFTEEVTLGTRRLLKNRDIQHIYLPIFGKRKKDISLLSVIQSLHPTPALGGEPREAALQWLAENECGRGLYGAPIGWLSLTEDIGEFAVGIRSGVFSSKEAILYAGCGIVGESVAVDEENETRIKFQPMLRGVRGNESSKNND
ncbi:hypothetical protein BAU17_06295 [Enterococcus sp. CU12B]|uniref:isochorismate synthase n=1 Tax=Candidatus Enterococcus willemsii TaxID=1857215 RepID=A0ABQ6YW12_9ENTE|nr:hypothetical protein BAU17_06295 [Enterococcus sp. CU12B]